MKQKHLKAKDNYEKESENRRRNLQKKRVRGVFNWMARGGLALFALFVLAACQPPPPGTPVGTVDSPTWVVGDSISWPTGIRIPNAFAAGVGGSGCIPGLKEPTISTQMNVHLNNGKPSLALVITGINDIWAGTSAPDLATCAETFRATYESQGINVRFVTQPLPDNGFGNWTVLADYNNWLVATYSDTIDCGPAGHPTEPIWYPFPVHPTAAGYDRYAACITGAL